MELRSIAFHDGALERVGKLFPIEDMEQFSPESLPHKIVARGAKKMADPNLERTTIGGTGIFERIFLKGLTFYGENWYGRKTVKIDPFPYSLRTVIFPFSRWTKSLTIARPRPLPPVFFTPSTW